MDPYLTSSHHHRWSKLPPEILDLILQRLSFPGCLNFGKVCTSWRSVFNARRRLTFVIPRCSWSELPRETLDLIPQRLSFRDCFDKVCTSWRSVFPARCRITRPPSFVIPRNYSSSPLLWFFDGRKLQRVVSPTPKLLSSEWITGSLDGWMVIASYQNCSMFLLNFTSDQRIPLPSSSGSKTLDFNVVLSSSPNSGNCILANRGFVQGKRCLAYCRPRDLEWTSITPEADVRDIIFHKDELYVNTRLCILVYTFTPHPKVMNRVSFEGITGGVLYDLSHVKLVVLEGELLLVVQRRDVFRLTSKQDNLLERVESLGNHVLLLGATTAESLCTKELMGSTLEPNCIYSLLSFNVVEKYSIADQSCKKISIPEDADKLYLLYSKWFASRDW